MNEFQGAERRRLEEPAADIGLEPLCAMVCTFLYTCSEIRRLSLWIFVATCTKVGVMNFHCQLLSTYGVKKMTLTLSIARLALVGGFRSCFRDNDIFVPVIASWVVIAGE
jgi:hypothetical protein